MKLIVNDMISLSEFRSSDKDALIAHLNDRDFRFTEAELDVLRRAAAGEDVHIEFLTAHKAGSLLRLYGHGVARRDDPLQLNGG